MPASHEPVLTASAIRMDDGAELPMQRWAPKRTPRAVILALHGYGDYRHAFALPGAYWAKRGIATYAYDQRGFGASPQPGIWPGEANLLRDVAAAVRAVQAHHPHVPLFVLGESMGGAVIVSAVAQGKIAPRGIILSAPAVWPVPLVLEAPLWMLAHAWPSYRLTGEGLKIRATDNMEILRELARDPLVQKGARADAVLGLTRLMDEAYAQADHVTVPVLILYGAKDEIIPRPPVERARDRMPGSVYHYYDEGYHLLLRDLQAETVWRDVADWVLSAR